MPAPRPVLRRVAVAMRTVPSPIGALTVFATRAGVLRLAFAHENVDRVAHDLASLGAVLDTPHSDACHDDAERVLTDATTQLERYFTGSLTSFSTPLDTRLLAGYRGRVQRHLTTIAFGDTRTYRQLAEETENPRAVRAVGTACATNPLPLLLPCHRVLRSDGSLGGYRGGLEAKQRLLDLERRTR